MKKLNALNLGKSLNREEMKSIMGGVIKDCKSTCTSGEDAKCKALNPMSYCFYTMCEGQQKWSCQYVGGQ